MAWKMNEYASIPDMVPVDALTDTVRAKVYTAFIELKVMTLYGSG